MMQMRVLLLMATMIVLAQPAPATAQRRGERGAWSEGAWSEGGWPEGDGRVVTQANAEPSKRIDVDTFRAADAGAALGKGRIVVVEATPPAPPPNMTPEPEPGLLPGRNDMPPPQDKLPVYEAAVIDRLAAKGYDIATAADPQQLVEIGVSHDVVVPEELPHKPVSGEVSMTVSNRGSGFGGALFIDLSKPRKAIVATRLDVRIRDKATRRVLWEGYAQGQARMTDSGYDDTQMATRLAGALFARFPDGKVVQSVPGAERLTPAEGAGE